MKATAKDLCFHSKELLGTVSRGEEVIIMHRGKPCANWFPTMRKRIKKYSRASFLVFGKTTKR
jgi:antitoxin (DNA-binding transcriptional repressor) of toxin-antitoxin stability system